MGPKRPGQGDEGEGGPDPPHGPLPAEEHDRVEEREAGVGSFGGGVDGGQALAGLDLEFLQDGPEVDALDGPLAGLEVIGDGRQDLPTRSVARSRSSDSSAMSPARSDPTSAALHGRSPCAATVTSGSGPPAPGSSSNTARSSRAAARSGERAAAIASPRPLPGDRGSSSHATVLSTSSDEGTPSRPGAAPCRKRTPTTVAPGARVPMMALECGPITLGSDPISTATSMLPFGTVRCV